MPACLEISFCSLEEKNKWEFQWIRLSLGQARYAFCLNLCKWWVSFGFNFNGTWLCKLWFQIQFLSTVKEKKDILIELRRNRPQLKNYIEIVYSFIVSIQILYHLMPCVTLFSLSLSLSLKIKRLIYSWIINIDFSITQVFILC